MRRIKLVLAYDGTAFHGWQVQPGLPTIQGTLEEILRGIEGRPVQVAGSGRTDAGVHALGQVGAVSLENPIPTANLRKAMNRLLPPAIRVLSAVEVHAEFHPRFDALAKTYEYRIARREVCSPFEWPYLHHFPYPLDFAAMARLAPLLEGEHDFSAFAASDDRDAEGKSKVRRIFASSIETQNERLIYRITGSGFLKHMVRNIAGTLLQAGKNRLDTEAFTKLLDPACRVKAGPRAPAKGLTLVSVQYAHPVHHSHSV
ncbi:MAG: tRNA pseudouridine(38-40) synthase TruA [Acidobacteriota bacterium]|nr:tRNA pseudouridine(38-40) synthase TruA [Acidobacteriota bacterium]